MIKIIATRCYILKLQFVRCTKFDFGKGSTLDPTGGAHNAFPDSLAGFKESYFKGKENGKRKKKGKKKGKKRCKGRGKCEGDIPPPLAKT